jgi:hypothetical protein
LQLTVVAVDAITTAVEVVAEFAKEAAEFKAVDREDADGLI